MKKLIRLNISTRFESVNNCRLIRKNNRRAFAFALLFICGSAFTLVNAQSVNYKYDASGNVTSRVIVKPQNASNLSTKKDSLPSWGNLLAYSPSKATTIAERWPATPSKEIRQPLNVSDTQTTKVIALTTASRKSTVAQPQVASSKKIENKPN